MHTVLNQAESPSWKDCGGGGVVRSVKYYYIPAFGGADALAVGEAENADAACGPRRYGPPVDVLGQKVS